MTFATVCSGIEAPSVAWHKLGWRPLFFSEIEKFPSAVLAHHYPGVPNHGDMTNFKTWPNEKPKLVCGGTPCQSFSVAGLRKGMADPRGNLALVFLAIVDRYRPEWLVWENVPGVLSSNKGRDFGAFIGALAKLGYGFAWRILDAQYFGVPQRRRRVFVVGHSGGWQRATAVLFERACLSGHPAPRRKTRQDIAPTIASRTRGGGGLGTDFDCDGGLIMSHDPACTITARESKGPLPEADLSTVVAHTLRANWDNSEDGTGRGTPMIARSDLSVRRLTPRECERLQGFPDDYTDIPWRGKPHAPDGPRYKALGNSMAVPVMRWIGERIALVEAIE